MELGKQIKKCRTDNGLSQEELASQIYVSRQTISNWETDKNYPDLKSLLLLSSLFDVSLDQLVKGDLKQMKDEVKEEDVRDFHRKSRLYAVILLFMIIAPVPLTFYGGFIGFSVYIIIAAFGLWLAFQIEKQKKSFDIKTYKEIIAFTEGKTLDENEKNQEIGKRPYQATLLAIGVGFITMIISIIMIAILF